MDGLSVAAQVAAVAALGLQSSQTLYALINTLHDAGREIASVANDVSLLAAVLKELEVVLRQDSRLYRRQLVKAVLEILKSCEGVFKGIKCHVDVSSSGQLPKKIASYFKRERVKALQAGLGTLKSTLNVLSHVVQLAKVAGEAQFYQAYPGPRATRDDIQRVKRSLVEFLIGNRQDILQLQELEKELEEKSLNVQVVITGQQNDGGVYKIFADVDGPSIPNGTSTLSARQPSGDKPALDDQKNLVDKEGMQSLHPTEACGGVAGSDGWNDWYICKMEEHKKTEEGEKGKNGELESVAPPLVHVVSLSGEHIDTESASKEDPPESIPTAQLFLDIVPHIGTVAALISRPFPNETASVQTRAEDTAKTLLLTWMGMDLDFVFEDGDDSDPWNSAGGHQPHAEVKDTYLHAYSDTTPSGLSQYHQSQTYAPNTWLPQHQFYNQHQLYLAPALSYLYPQYLSYFPALQGPSDTYQQQEPTPLAPASAPLKPSPASVNPGQMSSSTPSKTPDNDIVQVTETESEEQDLGKSANDELHEPGQDLEHWMRVKRTETELRTAAKVEEVVILKDAVGRSLELPFDSCKTKDGLEKAIKEAMLHDGEYSPLTEAGCYDIVNPDGEIILRSCWESMVQPGWQITMAMWPMSDGVAARGRGDTDTSDSTNDTNKSNVVAVAAPVASSLHTQMSGQLEDQATSFDSDANGDDDADADQLERALWESSLQHLQDRYVKNENLLTKQKRARISLEVKLERNRRFVQLRQQLADQEALLQARQEAADEAEQEAQLSWLEKQAANQKAELDALSPPFSPPLLTPPSSTKSISSSKSDSGLQRKSSVRARLFGRASFRSVRSKGSEKSGQLSGLDETVVTSLSGLRLMDG